MGASKNTPYLSFVVHLASPKLSSPLCPSREQEPSSRPYRLSLLCHSRSTPASAALRSCLMVLQKGHPRCPHTAPTLHLQVPNKFRATAQWGLVRGPSISPPQTSTQDLALKGAQQAALGVSSRVAMCLSTPISGISMKTSSLRPRQPCASMDTHLRLWEHWKPLRKSLWKLGRLRPSFPASQQRPGAMGSPTPARSTAPKFW